MSHRIEKNGKIIGYEGGDSFSKEDLNKLAPNIKTYSYFVLDDEENEGRKVYGTSSKVAAEVVRDILKDGVKFELYKHSVKRVAYA